MNRIDIANGIVFQKLNICKGTFEDRLICQKKIYLLQSLGTDLGYAYNWYVRGPYSPALTSYIFSNLEVLKANTYAEYKLSPKAEQDLLVVNSLADEQPSDLQESTWYELLASLVYIFRNRNSWRNSGKDEDLINTLREYKPQFSIEQCSKALDVLKKYSLIENGAA